MRVKPQCYDRIHFISFFLYFHFFQKAGLKSFICLAVTSVYFANFICKWECNEGFVQLCKMIYFFNSTFVCFGFADLLNCLFIPKISMLLLILRSILSFLTVLANEDRENPLPMVSSLCSIWNWMRNFYLS